MEQKNTYDLFCEAYGIVEPHKSKLKKEYMNTFAYATCVMTLAFNDFEKSIKAIIEEQLKKIKGKR
jgi:hypothetical protein